MFRGAPLMSREMGLHELNVRRLGNPSGKLFDEPSRGSACMTCGSCASACPISGVDGMDPRKMVRMAVLGLEEDIARFAVALEVHNVRQM